LNENVVQMRLEYRQKKQQRDDVVLIVAQQKTIQSLAEHRNNLLPDQACPLCGSVEHPAIEQYQSIGNSEQQQRLIELEQQLIALEQQGKSLGAEQAKLTAELTVQQKCHSDILAEQTQLKEQWQSLAQQLYCSYPIIEFKAIVTFIESNETKLEKFSAVNQQLQQLNQNILTLQQKQSTSEVQQAQRQTDCEIKLNELLAIQNKQQDLNQQYLHKQQVYNTQLQEFNGDVKLFFTGVQQNIVLHEKEHEIANEETFKHWFNEKQQQINYYQQQLSEQEQNQLLLAQVTQQIAVEQNSENLLTKELAENEQQVATLKIQLQQLQQQRFTLFGDKNVQNERIVIGQRRDAENQKLQLKQQQYQEKLQLEQHQQTLLDNTQKLLTQCQLEVQDSFNAWQVTLSASIFDSEYDFVQALLSLEQQEQFKQVKLTINNEKQRAQSILEQQILQCGVLVKEQEKLLADGVDNFDLAELTENIVIDTETLKNYQVKQGQLTQSLLQDQQHRKHQQTLLERIDTQQFSVDDLAHLNGLIGSADGAKFRKFAQELTLAHLVYLANQQLSRLDGRYQLQCQQSDGLALEVLDTWQADTVRDTKTLSGGESFLVSLALALALSDLVSAKTSIDSLFLDEGFGTLDNDTLEVALDALDSLNASGKMIGVISHVDTLKERISVQIKVKKRSGLGTSTLEDRFKCRAE